MGRIPARLRNDRSPQPRVVTFRNFRARVAGDAFGNRLCPLKINKTKAAPATKTFVLKPGCLHGRRCSCRESNDNPNEYYQPTDRRRRLSPARLIPVLARSRLRKASECDSMFTRTTDSIWARAARNLYWHSICMDLPPLGDEQCLPETAAGNVGLLGNAWPRRTLFGNGRYAIRSVPVADHVGVALT